MSARDLSGSGTGAGSASGSESTLAAPVIGIMIYDNPKECGAGYASIDGSEPTYVRQPEDLANNVIWVTNADFQQFFALGHRNVHNLRGNSFLRTQLHQIASDLGLDLNGANAYEAAPVLSKIVSRVFKLIADCYEWKNGEIASADSLQDNIKSRFPRDQYVTNNPSLERALLAAFQTDSLVTKPHFNPNSVFLTLRMNRLTHAQKVMSCPLPDDAWEFFHEDRLPASQRERLALCLESGRPVLAEVELDMSRADSEYAQLAAFGKKQASRMELRKWVSHPELIWLTRVTPLNIKSIYMSAGYRAPHEKVKLPARLTEDPLMRLSYSAGLLAENHWVSLASDEYMKMFKKKMLTARAVWLRASDRALCFMIARRAHDEGFNVTGYGAGGIRIQVSRSELFRVVSFAIENQLVSPDFSSLITDEDVHAAAA